MSSAPSRAECAALDEADDLASYRSEFVVGDDTLVYFDGNSLGRLPVATVSRLRRLVEQEWGSRLIRGWEESWLELPTRVGDLIGIGLLGAGPGETVVSDNTTVCLYKAMNAALDARPGRDVVVIEEDNFPTDRYVVESLARQRDLEIRWIPSSSDGVSSAALDAVLDESVAVAVLSQVDYRSAALLDLPALTEAVHRVEALVVWDLCHSVGVVPIDLPAARVDVAVGCTYKYLNGGPGAPAFTYVGAHCREELVQPIWGWWSRAQMFEMAAGYTASPDIRAWLTGTPGILSLAAVECGVDMVARAGVAASRRKSVALTSLAIDLYDAWLAPAGMELMTPRDHERRGSHVTVVHPNADKLTRQLVDSGVIPDYRRPDGIRIGLAPLTTRFVDVYDGLAKLGDLIC